MFVLSLIVHHENRKKKLIGSRIICLHYYFMQKQIEFYGVIM